MDHFYDHFIFVILCIVCLIVIIARILFKNSSFVFHRNNKSIWVWKRVSKWQNIPLIDAGPSPKRIGCTRGHYWCTQLIIPSLLGGTTPFHLQLSFYILFDNVWVLIWERHTDTLSSAGLMMASIFMLYLYSVLSPFWWNISHKTIYLWVLDFSTMWVTVNVGLCFMKLFSDFS